MKTFMSLSDLDKLADDDPAKPVVKQLLEWLIAPGDFPDHPYDPEDHGYIALVEPGDVQRELDDIDMPRLHRHHVGGRQHHRWVLPRRVSRSRRLRHRLRDPRRCTRGSTASCGRSWNLSWTIPLLISPKHNPLRFHIIQPKETQR